MKIQSSYWLRQVAPDCDFYECVDITAVIDENASADKLYEAMKPYAALIATHDANVVFYEALLYNSTYPTTTDVFQKFHVNTLRTIYDYRDIPLVIFKRFVLNGYSGEPQILRIRLHVLNSHNNTGRRDMYTLQRLQCDRSIQCLYSNVQDRHFYRSHLSDMAKFPSFPHVSVLTDFEWRLTSKQGRHNLGRNETNYSIVIRDERCGSNCRTQRESLALSEMARIDQMDWPKIVRQAAKNAVFREAHQNRYKDAIAKPSSKDRATRYGAMTGIPLDSDDSDSSSSDSDTDDRHSRYESLGIINAALLDADDNMHKFGGIRIQTHFRSEPNSVNFMEFTKCHSSHPVVDIYMLYDGYNMQISIDECIRRLQNVIDGYEYLADHPKTQVFVKATLYSNEDVHEFPPIDLAMFSHRNHKLTYTIFDSDPEKHKYDYMARYFLMDSLRTCIATASVKILHMELHFYRTDVLADQEHVERITSDFESDTGRHIDCWRRVRLFEHLDQFFRVPSIE